MQEANDLERQRRYGIPLEGGKGLPAKGLSSFPQENQYMRASNSISNQKKASKPEQYQQVKRLPTDPNLTRFRQEWNGSSPLLARSITYPDDHRESVSRGPSAHPKVRSPKSPTHYIPDRLPSSKITNFSKEHSARSGFRTKRKPPIEDEEQPLQADDPSWLEVMRLVEDMKIERLRRQEHQRLKKLMYQKIEAMKLRRSHRHGITIHQSENASSASPHSLSHVDPIEEKVSVFPASEELRQLKPSLLEKIEAMRLRRSLRHGAAIYPSEASVPVGSDSPSGQVEVREVSSKIEPQPRSSKASPQQLNPSLWQKVEAMKQRLSRRQGTAIYQAEGPKDQDPAPPSDNVDQVAGVLPGTQVHKPNLILDRPPNLRVHSCQAIEAVKPERSSRQGIARSV